MPYNIDTSNRTSSGASYSNQYDLQRQKIREEEERRRKEERAALERRLASRGFTSGTGYAESQIGKYETGARAGERERLGTVDLAQLASAEQAAEKEREKKWLTGERLGTQQYQTGERLGTQRYQTKERLGTQQYGTSERLGREAFQTGERVGAQKFAGEQAAAERGLRQQEITIAAVNASNRLDFDYWATSMGYSEADKERAWAERQGILERNAVSVENAANRNFRMDYLSLDNQLNQGTLILQDTIANNNTAMKTRMDLMYSLGTNVANGAPEIDTTNLSQIELDAYEMGKSGESTANLDRYFESVSNYTNAQITALAEDEDLGPDIRLIYSNFFGAIFPQFENPVYGSDEEAKIDDLRKMYENIFKELLPVTG